MHARSSTNHLPRALAVALVLALFAALAAAPVTRAATSGDVAVTASITTFSTSLSLTLCDQTADFGDGLNAFGDTAQNTTDTVIASPDSPGLPNGASYQWTPSCATATHFLTVDSNTSWLASACATPGTITSSLTLDDLTNSQTGPFGSCPAAAPWTSGSPGTTNFDTWYTLRIESGDTAGSFAATTTWSVVSG
ncbi:MAG TPA: hypothetical protein VFL82_04345 [Thermomicrobiales bacterium]|nr:hypothetical protein [Thermomicrobiales bacterium]